MPGFEPDDEGNGPPPHPLDRTWLHPSEFAAALRPTPAAGSAPSARRRRDLGVAIGAGVIGALTTVSVLAVAGAFDQTRERTRVVATPAPAPNDAAAVAAHVSPGIASVVVISGTTSRRGSGLALGPHDLLTTVDVVGPAGGGHVVVGTTAGSMSKATVRGTDPVTGLVVVHAPGLTLTPAPLRDADSVRAGDWVVAVGRTSANAPWVSSGVVTATSGWAIDATGTPHAGLLAASTEVADDARGGALVDGAGRIVGVLATATGQPDRTAAIPIDMAADVADQILTHGYASHGALGIEAQDSPTGPVVERVSAGSGAAAAGLAPGDRIRAVDAVTTPDTSVLVYELRRRRAGARVRLTIRREGRTLHVRARLDDAASTTTSTSGAGMTPLAAGTAGS